jgi:hypothetical protein
LSDLLPEATRYAVLGSSRPGRGTGAQQFSKFLEFLLIQVRNSDAGATALVPGEEIVTVVLGRR